MEPGLIEKSCAFQSSIYMHSIMDLSEIDQNREKHKKRKNRFFPKNLCYELFALRCMGPSDPCTSVRSTITQSF